MPATIAPSEFVAPGETVAVVWMDATGPTRFLRATVVNVYAQYFTVEGVMTPGGNPRPVRFRNRRGAVGFPSTEAAHQANDDSSVYVAEDGTETIATIRRRIRDRKVENRMRKAVDTWQTVNGRRVAQYTKIELRPTAEDVDAALVEMIEAAVAMREMLGLPGEKENAS